MTGFKRVFRAFPGFDVLGNIESVNVLDVAPPGQVLGAGTGVVLLVGEFENGAPDTPAEVFGTNDLLTKFGGLGHAVGGNPSAGPVAVKSGGDELWNGNGFVWLRNKAFSGLIICRVDNSAGQVEFSRLACLLGGGGPFAVANNDTVQFTRDGSTVVTATFTGTRGTIAGSGFAPGPTGFTGGETLEIKVDQDATRIVVFTAADQTITNVVDRINAVLAQTVAVANVGELDLQSAIEGGSARIEIVGGTARATFGFPTSTTQQVDTYTINSNTGGGNFTMRVQLNVNGVLTNFDGTYAAGGGDAVGVVRDNLLDALQALNVPGVTFTSSGGADIVATGDANVSFTSSVQAEPAGGDMTIALTTPGVFTAAFGLGNVPNLANISAAEAVAVFDAVSGLSASVNTDSLIRVCNSGTPGTGSLQVTGGTVPTTFGFNLTTVADAAAGEDVTIPAGTRVQDSTSTGTIWVTMQDIETGTGGGTFNAKVRPFSDDDSALASTAGNVTLILDDLPDGFSVTNAAAITRLSSNQLDARYQQALDATLSDAGVARKANVVCSARSSESILRAVKRNALDATANGLSARKAIVRPPLATTRDEAKATTGVGVGNPNIGRDERVMYVFPGATTQIPEIQAVGATVGGTGFTDDGVIEVGADSFYASVRSQLPPEENAGQSLADTVVQGGGLNILSLQDAFNPDEAGGIGLTIQDYISFKANGIIALNSNPETGFFFHSDVTSIDPLVEGVKAPANRRFFADFIIDTLGNVGIKYVKKLNTPQRRTALLQEIRGFLRLLQSPNQPSTSRLRAFQVFDDTTEAQFQLGFAFIVVKVQMFPAILSLVFNTEVGTSVVIEEAA